MFPKPVYRLPQSRLEARGYVTAMPGLDYNKIHACINDCILFRGEYQNLKECPKCGEGRYRSDVSGMAIPRKVLRHPMK